LENDPAFEIDRVIAPSGGRRESESDDDKLFVHLIEQDRVIAQQHAWPPVRPPPSAIIPLSLQPPPPVANMSRTPRAARAVDVWDRANGFAVIVARSFRVRRQTPREAATTPGKKGTLPSAEKLAPMPRLRLPKDKQIVMPTVIHTARAPRKIVRGSPPPESEELGSVLQVSKPQGPKIPSAGVARQPDRVLRISVAPPVLPPL
jgi:hypothetical protein